MLGVWLNDMESLEAISQDDEAKQIFLRMAAMTRGGQMNNFLTELARDEELDDETKGTLKELAEDDAFLLAVEDYLQRTTVLHFRQSSAGVRRPRRLAAVSVESLSPSVRSPAYRRNQWRGSGGRSGVRDGHWLPSIAPRDLDTAPQPRSTCASAAQDVFSEQKPAKSHHRPEGAGLFAVEWAIVDSNHGPPPYQSGALTN
jgi:hypothetical protein